MLAARVRERLSRVQFAGDSIGATIGLAVFPADGTTAHELLARSDEDMMTGKLRPRESGSDPAVDPRYSAGGSDAPIGDSEPAALAGAPRPA